MLDAGDRKRLKDKARELPEVTGDPAMVKRVWQQLDGMGNMFIWQLLLSF